jgi:serine/threonine protein kinase
MRGLIALAYIYYVCPTNIIGMGRGGGDIAITSCIDSCLMLLSTMFLSSVCVLVSICLARRDLKPENFLFETKDECAELKVIDFGLSRMDAGSADAVMTTRVGTPYYIGTIYFSRYVYIYISTLYG